MRRSMRAAGLAAIGLMVLTACDTPFETVTETPAVAAKPPYPPAPAPGAGAALPEALLEGTTGGALPKAMVIVGAPGIPPGTAAANVGIPAEALPPPGQCRIWMLGAAPGNQLPPGPCNVAVPPGAVLVGS